MKTPPTRDDCVALDAGDPLASMRAQFYLPEGLIYLDGNSLGPLPLLAARKLGATVTDGWGARLIGGWNEEGWMAMPTRVGDKIARLVGAAAGEVVCADSTSVNLFKVLAAALAMRPERRVILSERGNFPTDLYIAQGLVALLDRGHELRLVDRADLPAAIDDSVAVTLLTQVDYRDGSRLDIAALTRAAHAAGALAIWDLAHSAGAFPVDLNGAQADFAVGCGYKYLNGGPGANAFLFVAERHQADFRQPLSGWIGHARPFDFVTAYEPAAGIARNLCGTPNVLTLTATECGVDTVLAAEPFGGLEALALKAATLIDIFVATVEHEARDHGLRLMTPRAHAARGNQASFALDDGGAAYAVVQALIARGVVGDFRAPDIMRFGFAPLYLRHVDAFDAARHLAEVMSSGEWRQQRFMTRKAVT